MYSIFFANRIPPSFMFMLNYLRRRIFRALFRFANSFFFFSFRYYYLSYSFLAEPRIASYFPPYNCFFSFCYSSTSMFPWSMFSIWLSSDSSPSTSISCYDIVLNFIMSSINSSSPAQMFSQFPSSSITKYFSFPAVQQEMLICVDFIKFELSTSSPNALKGNCIYFSDYSNMPNPSIFFLHKLFFYSWHNKHNRYFYCDCT